MGKRSALLQVAGGCLAAGLLVSAVGVLDAEAARRGRFRRGGVLGLRQINVRGAANVPLNQVIEFVFNKVVDASTVGPATFQLREENATQTGFTKQIFGDFQVSGRTVRFFPRLPTHLRNSTGAFFPEGDQLDNASANAGLKPGKNYQIQVLGRPFVSPVRATTGRPLRRTATTQFATSSATDPDDLFTTTSYADSPPPQFSFSNPPDRVPGVFDQYTASGGTKGVPNDIDVSMFCTKVPIAPTTARIVGNVEFTLVERKGNTSLRRPINGSVFIEQNFDTTLMAFQPSFPLADVGTYALRVSKQVKDLTERHDFRENRNRAQLRAIYDALASARSQQPGVPAAMLPDPSGDLISDWPSLTEPDAVAMRGVLKANLLALGDVRTDEVDPRVMVIFSTRDEAVTNANLRIEFNKAEDLFDGRLSTAEIDEGVPSAASGIFTIAGGTAVDGDFFPDDDVNLSIDDYANAGYSVNWRKVVIPDGVVVNVSGSRPATLRAFSIEINGEIRADGGRGDDGKGNGSSNSYYNTATPPASQRPDAGVGGPGGGDGGRPLTSVSTDGTKIDTSNPGDPGFDSDLVEAEPGIGGQGGRGGETSTTTVYSMGGGGGGGGGSESGTAGSNSTAPNGWNGKGGLGGDGSDNPTLDPLVGGAGGGAGGMARRVIQNWSKFGAAGGGGGGALVIQTAGTLKIGATGVVRARGGRGGDGTGNNGTISGGPGGGGGGGSILLRSVRGFEIAAPTQAFDVSGGSGGTQSGSYVAPTGGTGGRGYVRLEDPSGGLQLAGTTSGDYLPVGGGAPSIVYTKFADLGVQDPRILEFANARIGSSPNNDAIFIEMQMTRESPTVFGEADLTAIGPNEDTTDTTVTSAWLPLKVHDRTGTPGGVFDIAGYDPAAQGLEFTFPIADQVNARGLRFVRYRITFQNDDSQTFLDPLPAVDFIQLDFQFNF